MNYDNLTVESIAQSCAEKSGFKINKADLESQIQHLINIEQAKRLTLTDVVLCLSKEEKDLIVEGLNSAIAICDWDNYQKEKYESPKAQVSWYYGLIEKLNNE